MTRLRAALVGAGLVGQAEHAFHLATNVDQFSFDALVDASATVRQAVGDRYGVPVRVAQVEELDPSTLDAIVCATPDVYHAHVARWALDHGLHVLCEKPLAFTLRDCDEMIAARDRSGKVAQVAYMKRHDPAYRRLLELLPSTPAEIRCISVEVNDPGFVPFIAHLPMARGSDVPAELIADGARRGAEQIAEATGIADLSAAAEFAFREPFLSSLVHDVSLLHGILERVGHPLPVRLADAAIFADGEGGVLGWALEGGGRASAFHLTLQGVNDYTERLTVYCADRILELTFPSPYLRNMPTRLSERRSDGTIGLTETLHHVSYEEAFENELRSFHRSITEGAPVETTLEAGREDVRALLEAHAYATARLLEQQGARGVGAGA